MNNRLEHIDSIKGIAIFLVVLGHQASLLQNQIISNWVNSFHLPLFMFAGGYVASKTAKPTLLVFNSWLSYILKKFNSLIIPYFFWSILLYPILQGQFEINIVNGLYTYFIAPPGVVLWFLHTYFFMLLVFSIYYVLRTRLKKENNIFVDLAIVTVLFLFCALLVKYIPPIPRNLIVFFPYFFLGVILNQHKSLDVLVKKNYAYTILFLSFLVASVLYNNINQQWINLFSKLIAGGSASLFFYVFTQNFSFNPLVKKTIIYFGQSSLVIYIVHFTLLIHSESKFINDVMDSHFIFYLLFLLCTTTLISYVCVLVGNIFLQFPYIGFFIFGRKLNKKLIN